MSLDLGGGDGGGEQIAESSDDREIETPFFQALFLMAYYYNVKIIGILTSMRFKSWIMYYLGKKTFTFKKLLAFNLLFF